MIEDVCQQISLALNDQEHMRLLAQMKAINAEVQASISAELLESLSYPSMTARYETVEESHANTFSWIFRPVESTAQYTEGRRWSDFSTWLQSGSGVYWINGKAGSGKSTLMKFIVQHYTTDLRLKQWAGNAQLSTASFFFWNSGTRDQRSQTGLLRSLLYEILRLHPELICTVLSAQWGERFADRQQRLSSRRFDSWEPLVLEKAFKSLISQTIVPLKLCLFIDGLDEFEGSEDDIAELFGQASISDNVKICCSSRPHQPFIDAFISKPGLRLQDLTLPDVRKYVHDRLEKNIRMQCLSDEEPDSTKALIMDVCNAANGVFLWVRIVVSSLLSGLGNHDDIEYLRMRLMELPQELDDLYGHMIFKVDKVYQQETAQLFQLAGTAYKGQTDETVLYWRRTKQLYVLLLSFAPEKEIARALKTKASPMTKEQIIARCKKLDIYLRTRCGGLIEVKYDEQDSFEGTISPGMVVSYLHRTVRDYLEVPETHEKLIRRTTATNQDTFNASQAIFRAHILMLKAFNPSLASASFPWDLIGDAVSWARRAEYETQTGQPEYMDEFFNIARQTWNDQTMKTRVWSQKLRGKLRESALSTIEHRSFFLGQRSMLTLAAQCGLYHYLDAKLPQLNVIASSKYHRSLLDCALVPTLETEMFICVKTVATILKYGADPNAPEGKLGSTPWQNGLFYLNSLAIYPINSRRHLVPILYQWLLVIELLLYIGADPHATVPTEKGGTSADVGRTVDEVFENAFGVDGMVHRYVQILLQKARLDQSRCGAARNSGKVNILDKIIGTKSFLPDKHLREILGSGVLNHVTLPQSLLHWYGKDLKAQMRENEEVETLKELPVRTRKIKRLEVDRESKAPGRKIGGCCSIQ